MNQKQESLLTLRAIISETESEEIKKEFLLEKIDACLDLIRPQVLLSEKGKLLFDKFARELANKGKIIYKSKSINEKRINLGN